MRRLLQIATAHTFNYESVETKNQFPAHTEDLKSYNKLQEKKDC